MPLLITNDDVAEVLEMGEALDRMEMALGQLADGDAVTHPRTALWSPTAADGDYYRWSCQLGSIRSPPRFAIRFKSEVLSWVDRGGALIEEKHNVTPGTFMGVIMLFDSTDGALVGIVHDGIIQHVRTASTAGVACRHLARPDASTVGMLGSGGMAEAYLEAFDCVRDLTEVRVYSPTEANRNAYAERMTDRLGVPVEPVDRPAAAATGADIVATCTNALSQVYDPAWMEPGQFIVNVGPVEMPDDMPALVDRAYRTREASGIDHVIGTPEERERLGEFYPEPSAGGYTPIVDVIDGTDPGRRSDEEVIFHQNQAIGGLQFVAIGSLVVAAAVEAGAGTVLPIEWFQESIKS